MAVTNNSITLTLSVKDEVIKFLCEELAEIDSILREAGFEYPHGARGVQDMADQLRMWQPGGDAYNEYHGLD